MGVLSQWHSFLFFNRGVRQKRSLAECNEFEYNIRLLEDGLGFPRGRLVREPLRLWTKSGRPTALPSSVSQYIVVHPGMGGSALNWPIPRYAELIRRLGPHVVITGTPADSSFLEPLRDLLKDAPNVIWMDGRLSGAELIWVLQNARAVVAPSTGVLHLAASTGVPTLGLFSQIRVQRAIRWGPLGPRTAVVEAPNDSPDAMSLITVDEVERRLNALIAAASPE